MVRTFIISIFASAVAITSSAQNKQDKKITKELDDLITQRIESVAPGCVVLVVNKGQTIYRKAFGQANIELNVPMRPEMLFRTGSMGKQYTAIAVLQLVEQGKISLQDSIQKYLPDFPTKNFTITIENLLTQTSGIADYQSIKPPTPGLDYQSFAPKQVIDYFKNEPLKFKPGSQFEYSNSNYFLLGYIIEKVTGMTYENYLQKNILDKAGLTSTHYIHPEKILANMSAGYSRFDGVLENADLEYVSVMYAAGPLISNVDDIYKWHQALYSSQLVKKESLIKATTPFKLLDGALSEYGYGWFVKNIDSVKTIEHSGSTDGFQADEIYLPDEDIFVVALFNCLEADMDWQVLTNDVARIALGKPLNAEVKLPDNLMKSYAGTYKVTINGVDHKLIITYDQGRLSVEDSNPEDRLPKVFLYAKSETEFYIKEAPLRFDFVKDADNDNNFKIVTYNNRGKDAEWKKIN